MHKNKRVSIIFPVYNEGKNIRRAIDGFFAHPAVDEVVAVDNNSRDASAEEIKKTKAKYVEETVQGYGSALRRGLREATGDILITCEPEGTFTAKDLDKLLIYGEDFDTVFGTRTHKSFIMPGADMSTFRRVGDIAVGKFLGILFPGTTFSDVGCTYKLIHRPAYEKIKDRLTVDSTYFQPEYMIRSVQHGLKIAEIPVHYLPRVGHSLGSGASLTGTLWKTIVVGVKMILFIIKERIS
ncbi:MAG: glycosyltransferase family 2 protein [Patescibacteria group bacterium]|nr:glycosyltransferase family 2 protein [Patescibacteria group bacterium]MDE2015270.1 glycosyltransferase family 2 protein [Patescibacteria group bacterium]MDE2227076.1 glycosyltransferase family 2 protein [Patescibacteria group bacterium]